MSIRAQCNLFNGFQPNMDVSMKVGQYLCITYGSNLRLGDSGEDPHTTINVPPEKVLISPETRGHKLTLNMWHGRKTVDEDMEDWGFGADSIEGHVAPRGGTFLITSEGVKVLNYKADGTWDEQLIPYDGGLLFFGGNYYGDFSVDNDGKVGGA